MCLQHASHGEPGRDTAVRRHPPAERSTGDSVQHSRRHRTSGHSPKRLSRRDGPGCDPARPTTPENRAANCPKWFGPGCLFGNPRAHNTHDFAQVYRRRHRVVSDATRKSLDVRPGSGRAIRGAPSRRRSKLPPPTAMSGARERRLGPDSRLGSVHTIRPLQRPPVTSTIPCEFVRAGKKGSPMMLNGRLRLRCAVSLAVQTRD